MGHGNWDKVNGRSAQCLSVETNIRARHAIGQQKIDGITIVTRCQAEASTGSQAIVQNSGDGIPIVTPGQLMLN
mgnify:FL=1